MKFICLILIILLCAMLLDCYRWTGNGLRRTVFRSFIVSQMSQVESFSTVKLVKERTTLPVVVNAFIDKEILTWLKLGSNRKKFRILVSSKTPEEWSVSTLRRLIESKCPELTDQQYKIRYKAMSKYDSNLFKLSSDEDVKQTLQQSLEFSTPLQMFIQVNPGVFPPTVNMSADPLESDRFTLVSFYAFANIQDPEELKATLFNLWEPFKVVGRIYIAKEGVNAQMAVPSNAFEAFVSSSKSLPLFASSRFNVDHEMSREDFTSQQPFRALHIRVREQIVADGLLEGGLDWSRSGTELSPLEWHNSLDNPNAIVLDCRNTYETDVGRFKNAIPLNTTFFRESWMALEEVLKEVPKDAPILTYCTGGIRCVKINAYLEQKMGFTNSYRLKGGIISYAKTLEQEKEAGEEGAGGEVEVLEPKKAVVNDDPQYQRHIEGSKFLGVNYVFDDRMGARVTSDVFTQCESCGQPCDAFTNCNNFQCNVRFIQCLTCRGKMENCCSLYCSQDFNTALHTHKKKEKFAGKASDMSSSFFEAEPLTTKTSQGEVRAHASNGGELSEALAGYSEEMSVPEADLLKELRQETENKYEVAVSRMLSGPAQGALLSFLASSRRAKKVLELGSFTGYSTLCLAAEFSLWDSALTRYRESLSEEELRRIEEVDRVVYTCEIDKEAIAVAQKYFQRSALGKKIVLNHMKAEEMIEQSRKEGIAYDLVFLDADKRQYKSYLEDMIGDKGKACILNDGAIVVVDNTLWKGLVLQQVEKWRGYSPNAADFGKEVRMRKVAETMHSFNSYCTSHPQLKPLLLPVRDGFTIIQYKS